MRICKRNICPNGEHRCCLECKDINNCDKLGKCSLDDDSLDLNKCSERIEST
ncbi:MAG: hypothetical protein ACFFDF_00260 [Candidatus Odinarchaeota archaeon]